MPDISAAEHSLVNRVGDWIDEYNLASLLYDAIKDEFGIEPTVSQCQEVWYRVLDSIGDLVQSCARSLDVDYGD